MDTVTVVNGVDNTFGLAFTQSDVAVDISNLSRVIIDYGGTDLDSDSVVDADAFDWTTYGATGIMIFKLGHEGMDVGNYVCTLYLFDVAHPNSQEWPVQFQMNVKANKIG